MQRDVLGGDQHEHHRQHEGEVPVAEKGGDVPQDGPESVGAHTSEIDLVPLFTLLAPLPDQADQGPEAGAHNNSKQGIAHGAHHGSRPGCIKRDRRTSRGTDHGPHAS